MNHSLFYTSSPWLSPHSADETLMLFADVAHMPHAFITFQSAFHHSAIISSRVRMCSSFFFLLFPPSCVHLKCDIYAPREMKIRMLDLFSWEQKSSRRKFSIQCMAAIYINTWINLEVVVCLFFNNKKKMLLLFFSVNTILILTEIWPQQLDRRVCYRSCATAVDC